MPIVSTRALSDKQQRLLIPGNARLSMPTEATASGVGLCYSTHC